MLEPYWAHLGPFWAIFGSVSAFVLDSGISASLTFRPCKRVQKTPKISGKIHQKYQEKYNLWTMLLMVFAAFFLLFLFLSWGMLQLGYVCLISGLCWALWAMLGHSGATLSHLWGILWFLYVAVGFCWARIGTILGSSWAILGSSWAILGHFRICVGLCFGLGHFSVVDFSSMQACAKNTKNIRKNTPKIPGKIQFVDYVADGFCCYFLVVFVSFLGHAAVRLCLPDLGLMLGIVGYVGTFWATLSHFWGILWFLYVSVGFCWARIGTILGSSVGHIGLILGHLGPIFGSVSAFVLDSGISASLTFRPCKACAKNTKKPRKKYNLWTTLLMVFAAIVWLFLFLSWGMLQSCWAILGHFRICFGLCFGLGHVSVVDFSSMQGVCKKKQKYQEKIQFVSPSGFPLLNAMA